MEWDSSVGNGLVVVVAKDRLITDPNSNFPMLCFENNTCWRLLATQLSADIDLEGTKKFGLPANKSSEYDGRQNRSEISPKISSTSLLTSEHFYWQVKRNSLWLILILQQNLCSVANRCFHLSLKVKLRTSDEHYIESSVTFGRAFLLFRCICILFFHLLLIIITLDTYIPIWIFAFGF